MVEDNELPFRTFTGPWLLTSNTLLNTIQMNKKPFQKILSYLWPMPFRQKVLIKMFPSKSILMWVFFINNCSTTNRKAEIANWLSRWQNQVEQNLAGSNMFISLVWQKNVIYQIISTNTSSLVIGNNQKLHFCVINSHNWLMFFLRFQSIFEWVMLFLFHSISFQQYCNLYKKVTEHNSFNDMEWKFA